MRLEPLIAKNFEMKGSEKSRQSLLDEYMSQKIMIIDDEQEILDMLERYFSLSGYDVITAIGGHQALEKLKYQPDIILLDINMPDIDGISFCRSGPCDP